MTEELEAASVDPDECFRAVEALCGEQGLKVERFESKAKGYLGIRIAGSATNVWELNLACDGDPLSLPNLFLGGNKRLLAHVSYHGGVCVNDGQGLSMDSDRRPDIAARTILEGYELL